MSKPDSIAVIVVTHDSARHLPGLAAALVPQLRGDDELLLVDNASCDDTLRVARSLGERVGVMETGANLGFAAGCQCGARATQAPLLLFLNPDCEPQGGCLDALRAAAQTQPAWGAWQAAVMLPDGRINTSGGVVHYIGIGWAGDCDKPAEALPSGPAEIAFPSGAAMVVRRSAWERVGGLEPWYFMYAEDLDLGLRLWLSGLGVGIVPSARVTHGYEFDKGMSKWFWLERNRWRTLLSVYPARLLWLLAPALLASELALLAVAARDGWLWAKLRAQVAVAAGLPRTLRRRRVVQRERGIDARGFAEHLTASLDSPYLAIASAGLAVRLQARYWAIVKRLLAGRAR